MLKKRHESEGELMLKKQHESEGELKLKKQHESEGDVSQYNIDGTTVATDIHGATLVAVPDVLDIVRIASALGAAVGDDEQSHTYRGVWSGIMDILLESSAREMAADQREFDANAIVTGQVVDAVVNVLKSVDAAFVTAICREAMEGRASGAGWTRAVAYSCVLTLFGFVFKEMFAFAGKAGLLAANPTVVVTIVACVLTAIVLCVFTRYAGTVITLVNRVITMLWDVLKRLTAKSPGNQQNSGNREKECLKQNKREKQPKRNKREKQPKRKSLERKERKEQKKRDSKCFKAKVVGGIVTLLAAVIYKYIPNIEPTLTFASWNVRTLNQRKYTEIKKTKRLSIMLRKLEVDIAALQETRWVRSGSEDEEHYTFSWKGSKKIRSMA